MWYLARKVDGSVFPFYKSSEHNQITIPLEFHNQSNLQFTLNDNCIMAKEPVVIDGISEEDTQRIEWKEYKWCELDNVLEMDKCLGPSIEKEMDFRESLVGREIMVGPQIKYKIVSIQQHLHCLTRYNIQNVETKSWNDIELRGKTNWSKENVVLI